MPRPPDARDRPGLPDALGGSDRVRQWLAAVQASLSATAKLRGMDGLSATAVFAAQVRAAHAILDPDPIFVDRYALAFAESSEGDVRELFGALPASLGRVARLLPCQRSRFAEEQVELAVTLGIDQYVILGAGLDSFAWRRQDLMSRLNLYEVDHPATQAVKAQRVTALGMSTPPTVRFVGADLIETGVLAGGLTNAGFDPSRPSIWSWLGVIVYLPLDAIRATLRTVATLSAPGSHLIASYCVTRDLMDPSSREFDDLARSASAEGGEPHITFMSPPEMEALSIGAGWPNSRSIAPDSLKEWFAGRPDGLAPVSYEWLLAASR